jgi:hypothetical protein
MKDLLEHMAICKLPNCSVPHCTTSKAFVDVIYPNSKSKSKSKSKGNGSGNGSGNRSGTGYEDSLVEQDPGILKLPEQSSSAEKAKKKTKNVIPEAIHFGNNDEAEKHRKHDLEWGVSMDDSPFDADEQQSLLEAEISRRRAQRAPKTVLPSTDKPHKKVLSSEGSVTGEIKKKAEAILQKLMHSTDTSTKKAVSGGGDGGGGTYSIEDLTMESSWWQSIQKPSAKSRCTRVTHFICVALGFMIVLSSASLLLLYVFGGEEWDLFLQHFFNIDPPQYQQDTLVGAGGGTHIPVETDGNMSPTMAPTTFAEGLPEYTIATLKKDHSIDVSSPQTKAYDFVKAEKQYFQKALKENDITHEQAEKAGSLYSDAQWRNRFGLATLYYSTRGAESSPVGADQTGGTIISKASNWTDDRNWLETVRASCVNRTRKNDFWVVEATNKILFLLS